MTERLSVPLGMIVSSSAPGPVTWQHHDDDDDDGNYYYYYYYYYYY